MNDIGKKISETRKLRGFTQEELAELSKVNLRTIQRIENSKNEPRGKTLSLICDVLQISKTDLEEVQQFSQKRSIISFIINGIFLILLNLLLMLITGYFTLSADSINCKVGGILLSFFIPFFIVYYSQKMNPTERILKFGSGYLMYPITLIYAQGFMGALRAGFSSWLFSCLLISVGVLFYGNALLKAEK